jgi:hypothetical protein
MHAFCNIGWTALLPEEVPEDERLKFLRTVALERFVPCFHEVMGGRVWRVAYGDVRQVKGPVARAIVRAVGEAPVGDFPFELAERFPDVALPGFVDLETNVDLPYAPEVDWRITDVGAVERDVESSLDELATEEQEDRAIWCGYGRGLLDCLAICERHLLAFTTVVLE